MNDTDIDGVLRSLPSGLFIGGKWCDSSDGATFDVTDPSTGDVIASVADATPGDGIRALDAAVSAAGSWERTPARRRSEVLRRAYELLLLRAEHVAVLISLEMGKPLAESRAEVAYAAEFLRWFSEEAVRIDGRYGQNPEGSGTAIITHRPVGPCYLITPWNFPLAMAARKVAPALAAGCTVVLKPAESTPLTTMLFAGILAAAGLPAGVVNVVTTTASATVSAPIIADPRLRKLSFTGSTAVGRALLRQSAENILRTSMELGGNAAFVVFDDADLDAAVDGAMVAKFRNGGQACTAANRFIVHSSLVAKFAAKVSARVENLVVGSGLAHDVTLGPLITPEAAAAMCALVDDALDRGARVMTGGAPIVPGTGFFMPTVLVDVPPDSRVAREEIFGPILPIMAFDSDDEALDLANSTAYGLVGYAYTTSEARQRRLLTELDTGMVGINVGVVSNASAPFGGVKHSGLGREGGREGIHEYLDTKYTLLANQETR
jgi:succinate-semialdehyde dehydrogenase/glutarate-semialdehyde dehydrogenase